MRMKYWKTFVYTFFFLSKILCSLIPYKEEACQRRREILSCLMRTWRNRAKSQQDNDPSSLSSRIPTKNPDLSSMCNTRNLYMTTLLLLATCHSSVWLSLKIMFPGVIYSTSCYSSISVLSLVTSSELKSWPTETLALCYASSFQVEALKNTTPCRCDYTGRNSASWNFICTKQTAQIMLMKIYSKWFHLLDHNDIMPHLWRKWSMSIE